MKTFTRTLAAVALSLGLAAAAQAQFTGPSRTETVTVTAAQSMGFGRYVTLEGSIVAHLREDLYVFRDETGEITVEIGGEQFRGRQIGPNDRVRLMGEIDRSRSGQRYISTETFTVF